MSTLKELVLQNAKEGKVVIMTVDGPMSTSLEEITRQPTEGLLYDLNRDKVTVLTLMDDPKWVNDYAVAMVIEYLHTALDEAMKVIEWYAGYDPAAAVWLEKYGDKPTLDTNALDTKD